jgi:hypothetical protein
MNWKTIQVDDRVMKHLETCKMIFLTYHPFYEKHHISNNKILWEAMKYYIKTEPKFKPLVEEDEAEDYDK